MRLPKLKIEALAVLVLLIGGLFYFTSEKVEGMPASFGSGDIAVYAVTKDGRTIELDKNPMTIVYNNQPIGGIYFKPWVKVTASSSEGGTMTGSYSYSYTYKLYVGSSVVKSGSKTGTGTLGSKTQLGQFYISDSTMEAKIAEGHTGTVKFTITVTVTWKDPKGNTHTKAQTFTASVSVYHQPTTYSISIQGGVDKSTTPVIT